jgi:hypothetical protein
MVFIHKWFQGFHARNRSAKSTGSGKTSYANGKVDINPFLLLLLLLLPPLWLEEFDLRKGVKPGLILTSPQQGWHKTGFSWVRVARWDVGLNRVWIGPNENISSFAAPVRMVQKIIFWGG